MNRRLIGNPTHQQCMAAFSDKLKSCSSDSSFDDDFE
jgi:hypothetical protein